MPMHQTDTLFHKKKIAMSFMFGGEADNHAINTVPRRPSCGSPRPRTAGWAATGVWQPATTGMSPGNEERGMRAVPGRGLS